MSLCPEASFRESLSEAEFWDYVLLRIYPGEQRFDDGPYDDGPPEVSIAADPCPVCGSIQACMYDDDGRPLVHAIPEDADL